ncbi:hypothetical protein [Aneurinibacillus uraniidurans]|uniref:hypothetical protein n=1 Tax=Aneurinibacillus uraniidurans TaxID=2966586 RepID=UPI00234B4669|nr:hypothetical protein [Aneurinibacillus sp. B1]WCN39195.1 hypothetical protein PO771_07325 [Aneurinibacillus sp. B1]
MWGIEDNQDIAEHHSFKEFLNVKWGPFLFNMHDGHFSRTLTIHEAILTVTTDTNNLRNYGAGVFALATSGLASLVFEDRVLIAFYQLAALL